VLTEIRANHPFVQRERTEVHRQPERSVRPETELTLALPAADCGEATRTEASESNVVSRAEHPPNIQ
jgi:hypothetical protein